MEKDDLAQEGMLALLEVLKTLDTTKTKGESAAFIKQQIRWGMLSYVSGNFCDVRMNKKQFFEGKRYENEQVESDEVFVDYTKSNPEDLYILMEDGERTTQFIDQFERTLVDPQEKFIWRHCIHTDNPVSTRTAALELGLRSNKTVSNIKQRVQERFAAAWADAKE